MKKNSFVEGTFLASISLIIIKILGAIYVIPLYNIIGELGGALYSYSYTVYSLVLNICVIGIPLAISKMVSEYNTLEMYEARERTLKIGNKLTIIVSSILFLATFVFARELSIIFIGNNTGGNSIESIELVIRSISFCLLIIPLLSVKKGYLQGQKYIYLSTSSLIIEQMVRISFVLMGTYLTINVFNYPISYGVAVAAFGSFIGGLAAYIYLEFKIRKNKKHINFYRNNEKDKVSNKAIIKKIIKFSIPLIIIAMASDIYNITDISLINRGLSMIGYNGAEAETIASIIATWASKICVIINTIACALSMSLLPHMVSSLIKKDTKAINQYFVKSLAIIVIIGLPMGVGISLLSKELYYMFFGYSKYGAIILTILPFSALLSNIHLVINSVLQCLNEFKIMYYNTIIGLLINALLDIPLILLCNKIEVYPYYGPIFATIIGYIISISIVMKALKKKMDFRYKQLFSIGVRSIYPVIIMTCVVLLLRRYISDVFTTRIGMLIVCSLYAIIGSMVYILLIYKNKLLTEIFGNNILEKILSKIRINKKTL